MLYLIDTTVLIPYFADDQEALTLLERLVPDGIAVSILSYLEAYQGVIESPDPDDTQTKFNAFFQGVPILPVSPEVARRCAQIRSMLKGQGKRPRRRAFDLVIAATALEHRLMLVMHNIRDFQDIPDLLRFEL